MLRKITNEDVVAVAKLNKEVWGTTYKNIINTNFLESISVEKWAENIKHGIIEGEIQGYVVSIEDKIVGVIMYGKSRQKELAYDYEIYTLNILPKFQKYGFGKLLLKKVLKNLKFCDRIYLRVLRENRKARSFYEKQDFVDTKRRSTRCFFDFEFTECIYEYKFEK
ncbi:GNAT family N-acetyltransferase [Gemella cuniculi]|uniref:GNAT family N-acetyltransferase n=1 Tax=Gemella cuniculi TaxID=150240 RepID=UPI0003F9A21F|nr:GNAT family N-acetyltransferase [Gemella cuniculi]